MDDIYETLKADPGEVFVSNVDEREFIKWLGEYAEKHIARMNDIKGVSYKILIRDGDEYTPGSSYAEYRWVSKDLFSSVPFYIYGGKSALLLFGPDVRVIVMDYPEIRDAFRVQFLDVWDRSVVVERGKVA